MVWGVEGGGGLPVRQHSQGGHRVVELWKASDWLKKDKKQLKVKESRQARVYLGFYPAKNKYNALLDQWQGSQGALFT